MDEREELIERARDGFVLEEFKESDVGRYLWARAEQWEQQAWIDFKTAELTDMRDVIEIQNRAIVADMFRRFVEAGIEEGQLALAELEREESKNY